MATTEQDLNKIWAETGGVTDPASPKYENGWIAEIPTYQNFNYVLQTTTKNILALAEKSAHNWNAAVLYAANGEVIGSDGRKYFCIVGNLAQDPVLDVTRSFWKLAPTLGDLPTVADSKKGLVLNNVSELANDVNWTGHDVHVKSRIPSILLETVSATKKWLLGNIGGAIAVHDLDQVVSPDSRDISLASPNTYKVFHEGNKPTQAQVPGTIPDANADGKIYGRKNNNWLPVTTTTISATPPTAVTGSGTGWYNLNDGILYLDINDGDSSQWVPANPPYTYGTAGTAGSAGVPAAPVDGNVWAQKDGSWIDLNAQRPYYENGAVFRYNFSGEPDPANPVRGYMYINPGDGSSYDNYSPSLIFDAKDSPTAWREIAFELQNELFVMRGAKSNLAWHNIWEVSMVSGTHSFKDNAGTTRLTVNTNGITTPGIVACDEINIGGASGTHWEVRENGDGTSPQMEFQGTNIGYRTYFYQDDADFYIGMHQKHFIRFDYEFGLALHYAGEERILTKSYGDACGVGVGNGGGDCMRRVYSDTAGVWYNFASVGGDFQINHDLAATPIMSATPGGESRLYYNGLKRLAVTNAGIKVTGSINTDSGELNLGNTTSSGEIRMYGGGGSSQYNTIDQSGQSTVIRGGSTQETIATFTDDGSCALWHNNTRRLETTATGAEVNGDLTVSGKINTSEVLCAGTFRVAATVATENLLFGCTSFNRVSTGIFTIDVTGASWGLTGSVADTQDRDRYFVRVDAVGGAAQLISCYGYAEVTNGQVAMKFFDDAGAPIDPPAAKFEVMKYDL